MKLPFGLKSFFPYNERVIIFRTRREVRSDLRPIWAAASENTIYGRRHKKLRTLTFRYAPGWSARGVDFAAT
jgi:hypothetical protein